MIYVSVLYNFFLLFVNITLFLCMGFLIIRVLMWSRLLCYYWLSSIILLWRALYCMPMCSKDLWKHVCIYACMSPL